MSKWQKVKLGDICNFVKGETGIAKADAGEYPLVVTGKERKNCDSFQLDCKAVCIPLVSSSGHGKASLNYVHYQEGKFALGSILVAVIPKDENVINAQFLHLYLSRLKDSLLVPLMKGSANVALSVSAVKGVEISLPKIEKQIEIINLFNQIDLDHQELAKENKNQQTYLTQLRQAILQEAIEGKLTADWRVKNPVQKGKPDHDAQALLETIKAEKQKLISDKKIKKEKPLSPINPDDVPFALPDGWVWVRLGEITLYSEAGKSFLCTEREIDNDEWGVVKVSSVSWGEFRERENKLYSKQEPENIKYKINVGDFLISRANTTELVGRSIIVRELSKNLLLSDKIIRFIFSFETIKEFSNRFNSSIYARNHFESRATGSSPSMKNVNRSDMELLVIPLPPLAEQNAIVERVDRLLESVNALEQQVTERKSYAEQLMQAVLKEAFAGTFIT